nr:hypothetical protein Itr_chr10CG12730 [Ipomoea trifida]
MWAEVGDTPIVVIVLSMMPNDRKMRRSRRSVGRSIGVSPLLLLKKAMKCSSPATPLANPTRKVGRCCHWSPATTQNGEISWKSLAVAWITRLTGSPSAKITAVIEMDAVDLLVEHIHFYENGIVEEDERRGFRHH